MAEPIPQNLGVRLERVDIWAQRAEPAVGAFLMSPDAKTWCEVIDGYEVTDPYRGVYCGQGFVSFVRAADG